MLNIFCWVNDYWLIEWIHEKNNSVSQKKDSPVDEVVKYNSKLYFCSSKNSEEGLIFYLQLHIFKSLFFSPSHTSAAVLCLSSVNPCSQLLPQSFPAMPTYVDFSPSFLLFMVHHLHMNCDQTDSSLLILCCAKWILGPTTAPFLWGHPTGMLKTCLGYQWVRGKILLL